VKYISEFRNEIYIRALAEQISKQVLPDRQYKFMEVCGTHTVSIARNGLRRLLPPQVKLVSGPGCPVCVTPVDYIDRAIELSKKPGVTIATFGDLVRVPGSSSSLEKARAEGADVRVVLSALDAVALAEAEPGRKVVFLGIGFETTVPTVAVALKKAKKEKINNFLVLSAHKTMPVPMRALASDPDVGVQGYICPGHVCTVAGVGPFKPLSEEFHIPAVVAGFEPTDILQAVLALVKQRNRGEAHLENLYTRSVREEGNPKALAIVEEVFRPCNSVWRGLGLLPGSGLALREEFAMHDAERVLPVDLPPPREVPGCLCGQILKGVAQPTDCPLFGKICTTENPVGACMVSSEGVCAAEYKWGLNLRKN